MNENDTKHTQARMVLRVIGPAIALVGLLFAVVGFGSFFASFGSFGGPPRFFWCAFIGLPLMAVGMMISKFAFLGAMIRYAANETAPVGKDVTNYMVAGTKDSMRDMAASIGEGISTGVRGGVVGKRLCTSCGAENEASANFCHSCGNAIAAKKRCAKCGDLNEANARFCDKCGAPA